MPAETVARPRVEAVLHHLGPEHLQPSVGDLPAHRPEPVGEHLLAGTALERLRAGGRAPVVEREARAVLHHRRVVDEARPVEAGGDAWLVDERVLEQPQVAVATERVDVLVVESDDRPEPLAEEGVEGARPGPGRAADPRRDVAGAGRCARDAAQGGAGALGAAGGGADGIGLATTAGRAAFVVGGAAAVVGRGCARRVVAGAASSLVVGSVAGASVVSGVLVEAVPAPATTC